MAKVEADLLNSIKKAVPVPGLQSLAIARVNGSVARAEETATPAPPPAPAARAVEMAPAAAPAPLATSAPVALPVAPAPRHLPRAGAKCPIHGSGCTESEHGG